MMADPGASRAALANLPVAALRLAPAHARLLERLGLRSIGALYDIPRAALERRFRDLSTRSGGVGGRAAAASVLLRLDQALGLVGEPRASQEEPPEAEVRRPFAEPMISSEGIAGALAHLARELCLKLEAQAFGGRRFVLRLYRVDATTAEVALGTSLPCRDAHHLCRVFADKLADIDAGFGIDAMALAAARLEPLSASQDALEVWPGKGVGLEAGPLIDRLSSRLGPAAVCRLEDVASHIPEKAQRWRPALAFPGTGADAPTPSCRALRPALLFEPPEPVAVIAEIPEGAPVRLVWRRRPRRIVKSEGPERIAPEWWHALGVMSNGNGVPPRTRDYYRLEDAEGTRYWVFREGLYGDDVTGEPRWKLQGIFA